MRLSSITYPIEHKKTLIKEHFLKSNLIVEDVCRGLTTNQRKIVEGIYKEFRPLIEASITPDQVQQIFTGVEKGATAAGGNRTAIGQGKDVVAKANEVINNVGKWLQNTTPVQAFDQKFEDLKGKVSAKFPDVAQNLTAMGDWAKANPGKTAAIIGVLTALASLAGGPIGGAIAGQVLKGATELLKGEKLSTAVGKGLKAAAVGWLAGKSFEMIGKAISGGIEAVADTMYPGANNLNLKFIANGVGYPSTSEQLRVLATPEDAAAIKAAFDEGSRAWDSENYEAAQQAFAKAAELAARTETDAYMNALAIADVNREAIQQQAADAVKLFQGLGAAAQGAASGATGMDKQGAPDNQTAAPGAAPTAESLRENQIRNMFYTIERKSMVMSEGIGDALKGMAGKAAGKLQQVGTNLTTKVTADKLMSAWKSAGSPTDSDAVAAILRKAGVSDDIINTTYTSMNLGTPAPAAQQDATAPTAPTAQGTAPANAATMTSQDIIAKLTKLDLKGKQRLTTYLQKQLGTA